MDGIDRSLYLTDFQNPMYQVSSDPSLKFMKRCAACSKISQVKVMDLRFLIWKPAPGKDGSSCVRIQGSNAICLVTLNAANHVIPSVLSS